MDLALILEITLLITAIILLALSINIGVRRRRAQQTKTEGQTSTAEGAATLLENVGPLADATAGYRSQLEAAGFSPTAAEAMAMDFHKALWARQSQD